MKCQVSYCCGGGEMLCFVFFFLKCEQVLYQEITNAGYFLSWSGSSVQSVVRLDVRSITVPMPVLHLSITMKKKMQTIHY